MILVKIMKRKDASSVLVAVILAQMIMQLTWSLTWDLSARLVKLTGGDGQGIGVGNPGGWRNIYLQPVVVFVIGVLALEILARVYVLAHNQLTKKSK